MRISLAIDSLLSIYTLVPSLWPEGEICRFPPDHVSMLLRLRRASVDVSHWMCYASCLTTSEQIEKAKGT